MVPAVLQNRLNHPYVVRYFSTWVENETTGDLHEDAVSSTEMTVSEGPAIDFGYQSTGGLDFVSSNEYPGLEFAEDDEDDNDDDDDDDDDHNDPFGQKERFGASDDESFDIFDRGDKAAESSAGSTSSSNRTSHARNARSRQDKRRQCSTLYI